MKLNAPGTADAPENLARGVLIVMPPGFGPEIDDAELPPEGEERRAFLEKIMRPRGVITAPRIDRGHAVAETLRWLSAAGFPVESQAKRFSILTWPAVWDGRARDGHVVRDAVSEAERLRDEFAKRTPLIAVFLSSQLLDAANDPRALHRAPARARLPTLRRTAPHPRAALGKNAHDRTSRSAQKHAAGVPRRSRTGCAHALRARGISLEEFD